jgi:hypothetical protein
MAGAPVVLFDDFTGVALDATNDWTVAGVNSGTCAINEALGGTARITTGAADDDDVDVASAIMWQAAKNCCMEVRFRTNDESGTAFNVGFTDAKGEAADTLPLMFATATLTSTASNCAMFFHDPDATTDVIRCVAVKADVDGTATSTGTAAADGTYNTYGIYINSSGDCQFWLDGEYIYTEATGITTTTLLCAYVGLINREGSANTADIDYIKVWQDR